MAGEVRSSRVAVVNSTSKQVPRLTHRHAHADGAGGGDLELGATGRHAQPTRSITQAQGEGLLGRVNADAREEVPHAKRGSGNGGGEPSSRTPGSTKIKGPVSAWLDSLSPKLKFVTLAGCVMVFFGLHNILQEAMVGRFTRDGHKFGWSLGMLEALGVLFGSMLERAHKKEFDKRVAPFRSYVLLAGLLGTSSSLSNIALNYIKYPTKVVFRSCKLIPTMAIAVLWRKKVVSGGEFLAAAVVCLGLIIFAQADAKLENDFDPRGVAMVMISVCADAFLPNVQEHVFSLGASRVEVTFYTNSLTVLGMLVSTSANGHLFEFLRYAVTSTPAMLYMLAFAILSHVAIGSHMMVLKEYGGVTAILVGSTRKAMTIALSFILFPKPFSYHFVLGSALVLGGLAANVMIKEKRKAAEASKKSHANLPDLVRSASEATSVLSPNGDASAASQVKLQKDSGLTAAGSDAYIPRQRRDGGATDNSTSFSEMGGPSSWRNSVSSGGNGGGIGLTGPGVGAGDGKTWQSRHHRDGSSKTVELVLGKGGAGTGVEKKRSFWESAVVALRGDSSSKESGSLSGAAL